MKYALDVIHNRAAEDQATAAIAGLLPSELTDKLVAMEGLREQAKGKWFGRGEELRILRAEVAELALAYQAVDNERACERVQAANYLEHVRVVGSTSQARQFQTMLRDFARPSFEKWEAGGLSLLEMAMALFEQVKKSENASA